MIRVGVIGLGMGQLHLSGYSKLSGVKIEAIADIDRGKLKACSEKYGIPCIFEDYKEMLVLKELDAVSICLPNFLHCPVTIEALDSGKHVLLEKPMALNSEEAERMVRKAKETKKVLMVGMNFRYHPEFQTLKELVEKGQFGEIYYVKTRWLRSKTFPKGVSPENNWFVDKKRSGGGTLVDIGVHMLDLALWLVDNFNAISVYGSTYNKFGNGDVDDLATALIRLDNGTTVSLEVSWESFTKERIYLSLFGTKGGAETDPLKIYCEDVEGLLGERTPQTPEPPEPEFELYPECAQFTDRIKEGKEPSSSAEEGLKVMKILDAIYESAKKGKEVSV